MRSKARAGHARQHEGSGSTSSTRAGAEVYRLASRDPRESAEAGRSTRTNKAGWNRALSGWALGASLALPLLGSGCQTNPVTGESELNIYSEADDIELGQAAYTDILANQPLVTSGSQLAMVERVMQRISAVSHRPDYPWEVVLIDDPGTVNAFCLPGGKMAVYTGILPLCDDPDFGMETGLAVVMGHEIAHATHRHGTNRLTKSSLAETAIAMTPSGWQVAAGTGYELLFGLPYGRGHETQSDLTGQEYMARAGYDPRAASRFWMRMGALSGGGGGGTDWFSTHPSDSARAQALEDNLPNVMGFFQGTP